MKQINPRPSYKTGLRRVWLVMSAIWLCSWIFISFDRSDAIKAFMIGGVTPVVALYALLMGIAWIIEGFSHSDR